jgi:hypothetical protein
VKRLISFVATAVLTVVCSTSLHSMPCGADTISAKRSNSNRYTTTLKKGDKLIGTSKVTVSKDGKVTTVDATGVTATGAKTHDVQVYDKQ